MAALSAAPIAALQLLLWHKLFGSLFTIPQGDGFLRYTAPEIWNVLFSDNHSLLLWHPLLLGALLGGLLIAARAREHDKGWLVIACLAGIGTQIYMNAIVSSWWAGNSFGNRRFVDVYPLFMIPLCLAIEVLWAKWKTAILGIVAALALWNAVFLVQYRFCYIPREGSLTFTQFVTDKFRLLAVKREYCD